MHTIRAYSTILHKTTEETPFRPTYKTKVVITIEVEKSVREENILYMGINLTRNEGGF